MKQKHEAALQKARDKLQEEFAAQKNRKRTVGIEVE